MISKKLIAAGLIAVTSLAAVPASAQGGGVQQGFPGPGWSQGGGHGGHGWNHPPRGPRWHDQRLDRQEVRQILRNRGFHHIRFVNVRGPVYQVAARRYGQAFVLIVSARNGSILNFYPI